MLEFQTESFRSQLDDSCSVHVAVQVNGNDDGRKNRLLTSE